MAESFTKLFSSIIRSTIWREDSETKVVWITMLAMSDRNGYVGASIPGLAAAAGVSVEVAAAAVEKFMSPDKWSRDKSNDGRRIAEADRGWTILNYVKFRDMRDDEARKEQDRVRKKVERSGMSASVRSRPPESAHADAAPDADAAQTHEEEQQEGGVRTSEETNGGTVRSPVPPRWGRKNP